MKISLIIISTAIIVGISNFFIIDTIKKHSVHPIYGNYQKVNSDLERCSPWESC